MDFKNLNFSKNNLIKIKSLLSFTIVFSVILIYFQNCSKVKFNDSLDPELRSLQDTKEAFATLGDESTLPPLKLFFVVDNSGTMAANNIQLAEGFKEMFNGSEAENLSKFNTSIYLLTTAQNIQGNPSLVPSRSMPLASKINTAITNDQSKSVLKYWSKQPLNDISLQRETATSGLIPGDLLGFEVSSQPSAYFPTDKSKQDLLFFPTPVVDFEKQEDGSLKPLLSIESPRHTPVSVLSDMVSKRLEIVNPSRYPASVVSSNIDSEKVSASVSSESGLCTIARVLKHSDRFLQQGDQAAFISISDENDEFEDGKNCIDKISTELSPDQPIVGSCQGSSTTFNFSNKVTQIRFEAKKADLQYSYTSANTYRINYTQSFSGAAATCKARYYRNILVNYSLYPIQTEVTYYTYNITDNIKVYSAAKTKIIANQDFSNSCNETTLGNQIGFSNTVEYSDALKKPKCVRQVNTAIAATPTSRALSRSEIAAIDASALNGLNVNSPCAAAIVNLTKSKEGSNADRFKANSCIVASIYESETSSSLLTMGSDTSSAGCQSTADAFCSSSLNASTGICHSNTTLHSIYTAAGSNYTNNKSKPISALVGGGLSCSTPCNQTNLCVNTDNRTIGKYLADINSTTTDKISNCAQATVIGSTQYSGHFRDENSNITCNSLCSDTKSLCPTQSSGLIVSEYLRNSAPSGISNYSCITNFKYNSSVSSYTFQEQITCDTQCRDTHLCQNNGSTTVRDYLFADHTYLTNYNEITCVSTAGDNYSSITKNETLNCNTDCSGTRLCPSFMGTVKDYLIANEGSLSSRYGLTCTSNTSATAPYNVEKPAGTPPSQYCNTPYETFTMSPNLNPRTVEKVEYVSGGSSPVSGTINNPEKGLISYIQYRQSELSGQDQLMYSAFTVRDESERNAAKQQTIGNSYIQLANSVGGKTYPVNADSYGPALSDLGSVIKKKLDRTVVFKDLSNDVNIVALWLQRGENGEWVRLKSGDQWTVNGHTVTLSPAIEFDYGDHLKANFK